MRLLLAHRREDGGQVVNGVEIVHLHRPGDMMRVKAVKKFKGPVVAWVEVGGHPDIARDHIFFSITFFKGGRQFRSDLSDRACYQDFLHLSLTSVNSKLLKPYIHQIYPRSNNLIEKSGCVSPRFLTGQDVINFVFCF